jgi:hypothetical protein
MTMHRRLLTVFILAAGLLLFLMVESHPAHTQNPLPTAAPGALISSERYIRADRLGITFISSVDNHNSSDRYRNALLLGAGWNRWPLYWNRVESAPGQYDWAAYDSLVRDDMAQGLQINAILLGIPGFFNEDNRPRGLNEPIYTDGSDTPGPGKTLNPANTWANFVKRAVERYQPGGLLAQVNGWPLEKGVRVWEIWNEPDHRPFWQGSINDYARLLKVAYIVIKQADPNATVMFGGLLFSTGDNWLARVLAVYQQDAETAAANNWYFDVVAVHSYNYPWRTGWLTQWVKDSMKAYGIDKPIWFNETGVAVWDDYPGPIWASTGESKARRATARQSQDQG